MTTPTSNWTATAIVPALVRGALELEATARGLLPHRLPAWARAQCADPQLAMVEAQPSGVRLVFQTRATAIELDTVPTRYAYTGVPPRALGLYDLRIDGRLAGQASADGGDVVTIDMATGARAHQRGPVATLRFDGLPGQAKRIEIWLPHNETTVLAALRANAPIEAADDGGRPLWLHHGSSISHGSNLSLIHI